MAPFPSGLRGSWSRWLCLSIFLKYLKSEKKYVSCPPKDKKKVVKGLKVKLGKLRLMSGSQLGKHF